MTTRRTALAFLGLAPAGALATEDFLDTKGKQPPFAGMDWRNEKAAGVLRRLADGIESRTISVHSLQVNSRISANEMLTQVLSIEFALNEPDVGQLHVHDDVG